MLTRICASAHTPPGPAPSVISAALVGYPNTGKSTLFNRLTHARQAVGNRAGVTVAQQQGWFNAQGQHIHLTDLPGCYTLKTPLSPDEAIAQQYLRHCSLDWVIQVIDATQLQRQLLLTLALKTAYPHLIVVLNRTDILTKAHKKVDTCALSAALNCPVIAISAKKKQGLQALQSVLANRNTATMIPAHVRALPHTQQAKMQWIHTYADKTISHNPPQNRAQHTSDPLRQRTAVPTPHANATAAGVTAKIDRWVLHPYWGLPFFIGVLYLVLSLCLSVGGHAQDYLSDWAEKILIMDLHRVLDMHHVIPGINTLLTHGVGRGLQTILAFSPVLGLLFFCMGWLEESGYLSRVVFITDRLMQTLRLPGQAFIPLIIGFGCNVPAVLSTRTLQHTQARIITVLMTPFMSCSARLGIYAIFISAFFPQYGGGLLLLLYLMGILIAILTGCLFSHLLGLETRFPLVMEMPLYQNPPLIPLLQYTAQKIKHFLFRSGRLILPVCVLIGTLNAWHWDTHATTHAPSTPSVLAYVGQTITPALAPLGIQTDNWPAAVGLLTGVLAKEVVIGTLNTLYSQSHHSTFSPTLLANAFHTQTSAVAYLLFILLYMPCISTMAVITRELNRRWATVSLIWSTTIAYATSTLFYQIGQLCFLSDTPIFGITRTILCTLMATGLVITGLCYYIRRGDMLDLNAYRMTQAGCAPRLCKGCQPGVSCHARGG